MHDKRGQELGYFAVGFARADKRCFVLAALVVASSCNRGDELAGSTNLEATQTNTAAPAADEGQSLAVAAGRTLLGKPAPKVVLTTIDGDRIDLGKLYGKRPVYLKFWATWCVPCREQMPAFVRDNAQFARDMTVIAVNTGFSETPEAIERYRREHGLTMPVVIDDGRLAATLNLRVTPQHVVIGRDGRIAYLGHLEDDELHRALAAAVRGPAQSASPAAVRIAATYRSGDTVAPFSAATLDGGQFALDGNSDGSLRALVFLSPWCESYLKKSRPEVAAACRGVRIQVGALAKKPGVRWLGIASGLWATPKDLADYSKENRVNIPLTLDASGDLFRKFGVRNIPVVILIDRQGRIVKRIEGGSVDLARAVVEAQKT